MRSKEDAHDYRYFPEPDLLPLVVEKDWIETIKKDMPELPRQKRERFISKYGITPYMAEVVTSSPATSTYVEATLDNFHPESSKDNQFAANWYMGEALRVVKEKKIDINQLKVTPQRLVKLLELVKNNIISASAAKKVFDLMESTDKDPEIIVEEQGLRQISDTGELEKIVADIIAKNAKEAARFKAGETKLMSFFVGQVMKETKGKGNPKEINKLVSGLINRG
jgi:aspartyl-tRNA(Asn)/glutamyl-tRNA(Gln) amidotransferase subunit B